MTTRTRTTRTSTNAGVNTDIAFGTRPPPRPNRLNSDRTATKNHGGDDDHGDGSGQGDDDAEPNNDPPDDDGPSEPSDDPDNSDNDVQNNLADAIAALDRNVQHQGDGSRLKVREPDPFDGTNPTKLRTFFVQLQLSFNDRPRAFTDER